MKYKLIRSLPNRFEDELNKSVAEGYKPVGNPFTVSSSNYIMILMGITKVNQRKLDK